MTAGIAAVNDRRNTAPEFPIHECPRDVQPGLRTELCFAYKITKLGCKLHTSKFVKMCRKFRNSRVRPSANLPVRQSAWLASSHISHQLSPLRLQSAWCADCICRQNACDAAHAISRDEQALLRLPPSNFCHIRGCT